MNGTNKAASAPDSRASTPALVLVSCDVASSTHCVKPMLALGAIVATRVWPREEYSGVLHHVTRVGLPAVEHTPFTLAPFPVRSYRRAGQRKRRVPNLLLLAAALLLLLVLLAGALLHVAAPPRLLLVALRSKHTTASPRLCLAGSYRRRGRRGVAPQAEIESKT